MLTKEAAKNAAQTLRELQTRLTGDRQNLIDLLVNCRDNQSRNEDLGHLNILLGHLETSSAALASFTGSQTMQQWEKK